MSFNNDNIVDRIPVSSLFHERLITLNHLDKAGFEEWLFLPEMLFCSHRKWWGSPGERGRPHEGLDLYFYRDKAGDTRQLDENTVIPVIFSGRVEKMEKDFLGTSVFVSHSSYESNGSRLYTIYGHIEPSNHTRSGEPLEEDDVIGTISDAGKSGAGAQSHLHISVAWIADSVKPEELDWQVISEHAGVTLINPFDVIRWPYSVVTDKWRR